MKPENFNRYDTRMAGYHVQVITYRLGDRFFCRVDNVDPGATIARGSGDSLETAQDQAFDLALASLCSGGKPSG